MVTPLTAANIAAGSLSGVEFGQDLSLTQQEQFNQSPDLYDRTINSQYLEVYLHYAAIERQREADDPRPIPDASWTIMFKTLIGKRDTIIWGDEPNPIGISDIDPSAEKALEGLDEKGNEVHSHVVGISSVSQSERERAYRALRLASWQAVFYLITTDILGFTAASQTFQDMGYIAGCLTYFFFYLLAIFAGQVIWHMYLRTDSSRFPVTCYADLGERTFGRTIRHIFNILQSGQLLFNVALLINSNAEALAQLIDFKVCFVGLAAIWFAVGAIGGQIRSLKNFAWFANCNIWLNIAVMIMTIYGVANYAPVPALSQHKTLGPIDRSVWIPKYTKGWYHQVSGVQLAVFAYGGAFIFPEFMAEMRRPRDFWKAAACAQFFCFAVYMMFGIVVYSYQGQYASILPGLDFDNKPLILANNIVALITTMVAAVLYGNIGIKVFYENVLRAYFRAPSLLSTKGRYLFGVSVIVYWGLSYIIAIAIPFLSALVTLVGALFILQFTYTFPPVLLLGFWMQRDAMSGDQPWVPGMEPGSNRIDSWKSAARWRRGFVRYWYVKIFLALMFLAALANSALGVYAGVETAIAQFKSGFGKPFSCHAPNDQS